jgi:putative ABC transport system substrate-binding protein
MEDPKRRRSWNWAESNGQRVSVCVEVGLFVLLAVSLCFCEKSYADRPDRVRRVGIVFTGIPSSLSGFKDQFRRSLAERGWVEGHNIIVEERYGEGKESRLLELAKELISVKTDVIIASSSPAARAAMAATKIIPIIAIGDPIGDNLVTNRMRPEANVTGLSLNESQEMSGKRKKSYNSPADLP